ncbi:MAG TPA: hypothetical protein VLA04_01865, partial [Verrucomicrobiae bacterium]|nr:hypothetical protein [Verrucomicrobiae bacterium]
KLMKPWNTEMKEFEGRRYKVIYANKIYDQLHEKLPPKFKGLRWPMGAIDQFVDHTRLNKENYIWRHVGCWVK